MSKLNLVWSFIAVFMVMCQALRPDVEVQWLAGGQLNEYTAWDAANPPSVCALDVFTFKVKISVLRQIEYKNQEQVHFKWQLIAKRVEGWKNDAVVASGPLSTVLSSNEEVDQEADEEETEQGNEKGLKCAFDSNFCTPALVNIRLPDIHIEGDDSVSLQKDHSIVLEFSQATNQPGARSKQEIDHFVHFSEYIGDKLDGMWSDNGRVLVIRIVEIDEDAVKPVEELMQGLLQTTVKTAKSNQSARRGDKRSLFEGTQRLRIEPPGAYSIRLAIHRDMAVWSSEFIVQSCDEAYVVMNPSRAPSTDVNDMVSAASPSFTLDGVLTHSGKEGLVLPHELIQMEMPGSWSLSFWVFLTEDSTGRFRTLFYNGDGERQQRTPSAWWKPDERRLVLRVSTNSSSDVGLDSSRELPLNQWTHVGFTFTNCLASERTGVAQIRTGCSHNHQETEKWSYSFAFYVNGLLDTEIHHDEPVLLNAGPLNIGKGPWTDGMQGFTSSLKTFPVPISAAEHRQLYLSERRDHQNYADCTSDDSRFDTAAVAAAKAPATQISFLSQCFKIKANEGVEQLKDVADERSNSRETFNTLQDFRAAMYEKAITARDSCKLDAWDLLLEAADLGHLAACGDVGESFLYGAYAAQDHCPAPIPVMQNLTLARHYLIKSFGGNHSAGKLLALLLEMSSSEELRSDDHLGSFTTGFVYFAAVSGEMDAFAMLGHRFHRQIGSQETALEIALYHYYHTAVHAANEFHQLGKQPLYEMIRLYDSIERDITVGERGDDDERIQYQKMQADKGDIRAMAAMGDLYYWGAHGVPRDHNQAYKYFNRAAHAGDVSSQSAVAGMLLKGEGIAQDNATSIKWYERAAEKNHTRALNGLGFIHFHGIGGSPENKTLALEYFNRAARNEEDGDSIFNAGYCHALGLGTEANVSRAMEFYDVAVKKFGHFDASFEMGKSLMKGVPGVPRDSQRAMTYLKAVAEGGQWGRILRKGFDRFTDGEFERAAVLYHEARELGYSVATSNLAFLYDQRLLQAGNVASERKALKYLLLTNDENGDKEALVRIGDYHYYGLAGLPKDPEVALRWYTRASARGNSVGAYNAGYMYEFGDGVQANLERAGRYYNRVLELSTEAAEIQLTIRVALARLALRRWLMNTPLDVFRGRTSSLAVNAATTISPTDLTGMFDIATAWLDDKVYALLSTTAIISVTTGVWFLYRQRV